MLLTFCCAVSVGSSPALHTLYVFACVCVCVCACVRACMCARVCWLSACLSGWSCVWLTAFVCCSRQVAAYAKSLGYKHVVMLGLSGGGWTTTVASAVVTDITLSIPTAGSMPKWPTTTYPECVCRR